MSPNKERIKSLEVKLGNLQEGMNKIELGIVDKMSQLEVAFHRVSEALLSNKEGTSHNNME